jgi:O-succinylbenzoate synthase
MKTTLWRQDVTMRFSVLAAGERHDERARLFLRIDHDGVAGFGEVAPQPIELNGDAALSDVIDELRVFVVPQLHQILEREGDVPSWTRVARFAGPRAASNQAVALVEMAILDRELRSTRQSARSLWPAQFETPLLATVSLLDDVAWNVGPGATRVRAKTSSATPRPFALERLSQLSLPVLLDFNCGAGNDAEVIEQVRIIGDVASVVGVEQPYAAGNVVDSARLAEKLDVPLSIDEGVRSVRDVGQIVRYRAAQIICVKPARVGGLANARSIIFAAREAGLRPYVGGFFESPYARHVHAQLAHNCVEEPSDLAPVSVRLAGYEQEIDVRSGGFGVTPSSQMLDDADVLFDLRATI